MEKASVHVSLTTRLAGQALRYFFSDAVFIRCSTRIWFLSPARREESGGASRVNEEAPPAPGRGPPLLHLAIC